MGEIFWDYQSVTLKDLMNTFATTTFDPTDVNTMKVCMLYLVEDVLLVVRKEDL